MKYTLFITATLVATALALPMSREFTNAIEMALNQTADFTAASDICPGSASSTHAACTVKVTFTDSCSTVKSEVEKRAKGSSSGKWTDPHNKGIYTITADSGSTTDFDHLTGNKKYTDKVRFTYEDSANGGQ